MSNKIVPNDYFENLPDRILSKIKDVHIASDIVDSTPNLDAISKSNPYSVPENYFISIVDRNYGKEKIKYIKLRKVISIAALCLMVLGVSWIGYTGTQEDGYFTSDDAIAYYLDNADTIDEELYIENDSTKDSEGDEESEDDIVLSELLDELSYTELEELQSELY